jgi:adenylyltransferase/sulfurtransferase
MLTIPADPEAEGRFSRFELISWWDQARLDAARVVVIGAGALGNEIVKNLALAGVGNVLIADLDRIEHSNLSRSVLFRETDNGTFKAETAASAARSLYPRQRVQPFVGNVVHDLGLGVYFWADLIIGGLDNREARVAINAAAQFAQRPWIDGAIEVLNGVARVFQPGDGPCYECTMGPADWKMLEARRSCALLTREQMQEGRVPTTPTIASVIAGVQVQEAIKLLHGLEAMDGRGFVYNGLAMDTYGVKYPRRPDCLAHEPCVRLKRLGAGVADVTVADLLARARDEVGAGAVLELSRDIIRALNCPSCGASQNVFCSLGKVSEREGRCPACGQMRIPETLVTLESDHELNSRTFAELGVPPLDVVTTRAGDAEVSWLFDGDAKDVLGPLAQGFEDGFDRLPGH